MDNANTLETPFDEKTLQHINDLLIEKRRDAEEEVEILQNRQPQ